MTSAMMVSKFSLVFLILLHVDNLVELNLRGNGLHGSEVSSDISDVILSSPCLEKFIFHDNDFSVESDEQLSVVQCCM